MSRALALLLTVLLVTLLTATSLQFGLPPRRVTSGRSKLSALEIKGQIRQLAKGMQNGIGASAAKKAAMAALVAQLEPANRVKKLTSSELLDGTWQLLFTTNEGSSAGKLGPFVGDVAQAIDLNQREYFNYVRLGPGGALVEGSLRATWDNLGDKLWRVKFQSLTLKVFGIQISKAPLVAEGVWRMTYLDDDLRILYAKGGKNLEKENVYILGKGTK